MIYHRSLPVIVDYNQRYMIRAVTYQATVHITNSTDDSLSCCRLQCLSPTLVRPNYSPLPERSHSRAGWERDNSLLARDWASLVPRLPRSGTRTLKLCRRGDKYSRSRRAWERGYDWARRADRRDRTQENYVWKRRLFPQHPLQCLQLDWCCGVLGVFFHLFMCKAYL